MNGFHGYAVFRSVSFSPPLSPLAPMRKLKLRKCLTSHLFDNFFVSEPMVSTTFVNLWKSIIRTLSSNMVWYSLCPTIKHWTAGKSCPCIFSSESMAAIFINNYVQRIKSITYTRQCKMFTVLKLSVIESDTVLCKYVKSYVRHFSLCWKIYFGKLT